MEQQQTDRLADTIQRACRHVRLTPVRRDAELLGNCMHCAARRNAALRILIDLPHCQRPDGSSRRERGMQVVEQPFKGDVRTRVAPAPVCPRERRCAATAPPPCAPGPVGSWRLPRTCRTPVVRIQSASQSGSGSVRQSVSHSSRQSVSQSGSQARNTPRLIATSRRAPGCRRRQQGAGCPRLALDTSGGRCKRRAGQVGPGSAAAST